MFELLALAGLLGSLDQYFKQEMYAEDFLDAPKEAYDYLEENEKEQRWFVLNPEKLKVDLINDTTALIASELEKSRILRAFRLLHKYSDNLPMDATFKERLMATKSLLPFTPSPHKKLEEAKIISLSRKAP